MTIAFHDISLFLFRLGAYFIQSVGEQPSTESSSFNLLREIPYKLSPLESLAIHRMFHGFDSIHSFVG